MSTQQVATEYRIEPFFNGHDFYHGWHLYCNEEWVKRGTALAWKVAELFDEPYPYGQDTFDQITWWDGFVKRVIEKYPEGVVLTPREDRG